MVKAQPSISEILEDIKEYYVRQTEKMYGESSALALKKKKEINNGYVVEEAIRFFHGEIKRREKIERKPSRK